jgi:hypothetical protein
VAKVEIEALLKNGSTKKFIAQRYHSSPANLQEELQIWLMNKT